jgi:hypothetical protein
MLIVPMPQQNRLLGLTDHYRNVEAAMCSALGTVRCCFAGIAERVRLSLKAVLECWKDKISEN